MRRAALLSLISVALVAQAPQGSKAPKKGAKSPAAAPSTAPKSEDKVLAYVGKGTLTESDLKGVIDSMSPQQRQQILMVEGGREEFIKRLAESKLIALKAKAMGLGDTEAFQRTLARTTDDLLARAYFEKEAKGLQAKMVPTDDEMKAYFESHKDQFKTGDRYTARHILVSVKGPQTGEKGLSDDEAKARVAKIQDELKGGKKFEDLAKEYSDDPGSKDKGGMYEDFDADGMVPEFAMAVKTQPQGEVGQPVKTTFGYHLIKVEGKKPAHEMTYDEAKEQVKTQLQPKKSEQVWKELIAGLSKEFGFKLVNEPKPKAVPAPKPAEAPKAETAQKPEAAPEKSEPVAPPVDKPQPTPAKP